MMLLLLLLLLVLLLLFLLLLLLLAARASAAARGVSISWLACAETRVLALSSPEIALRFLFLSVFAVFLTKKSRKRRPALSKKPARRSVSHRFCSVFSCLCRLSHRYLRCFGHLSTFCACQLGLAFVFQVSAVHATATGVLLFFC